MEANDGKNEDINLNNLACYLTMDKSKIYGECVIMCSKITENYTCTPDTIDINTIAKIIQYNIIHKGIKLKVNGLIEEFTFFDDPMENENTNYQWMELPLFKFNIIIFLQVNPQKIINKKATRLLGKHIVEGDIIIVIKSTEDCFINFTKNIYNKIIKCCEGTLESRYLTEEEQKDGEKKDGLPIIMNKYCILDNRYNSITIVCNYCNKKMDYIDNNLCCGCYRVRYCNTTCQKNDWYVHKNKCLYGKNSINSLLKDKYDNIE